MTSLVTDSGIAALAQATVAVNTMRYIGWGGGSGQGVASTDLALPFAEEARLAGTLNVATTNTANDTIRVTGSILATVPHAVTEAGIFDAGTGGDMEIYGDFAVINLAVGDTISFTVDVVIDQA